jgi:hypothetical protein
MAKRSNAKGGSESESIQGYFKRILRENPKYLKARSNEQVLQRWLEDHPGNTDIPQSVKVGLQNAKSALRSKRRKRRASRAEEKPAAASAAPVRAGSDGRRGRNLEVLEEQIDECLSLAKRLDREGLDDVIKLLRRARNEVVWKMG